MKKKAKASENLCRMGLGVCYMLQNIRSEVSKIGDHYNE